MLNCSSIAQWERPSLFDIGNEDERNKRFFLNRLVDILSQKIEADKKEDLYRPTQFFMKYIQRNIKYYVICYRSSKSAEKG